MSISEKIKAINNKIKQNKASYNLDRQSAKISALLSGNVSKYEYLTGKDVLPEKDLLEKNWSIEKIWIFSIRQKIKSRNWHCEKYQQLKNIKYKMGSTTAGTAFMNIIIINYLIVVKVLLNQNICFYSCSIVI